MLFSITLKRINLLENRLNKNFFKRGDQPNIFYLPLSLQPRFTITESLRGKACQLYPQKQLTHYLTYNKILSANRKQLRLEEADEKFLQAINLSEIKC